MVDELDNFQEKEGRAEVEFEEDLSSSTQLPPGLIWNILTGLTIVAAITIGLVFLMIFINPQSGLSPLPPPPMPALVKTQTPSPTPKEVLPPTWTPTMVSPQEPTASPTTTDTPIPNTPTPAVSPSPRAPGTSAVSFILQEDSPEHTENFAHEDAGCQWLGVAGQVFDSEGEPIQDILVTVKGTLGEEEINKFIFTGMAPEYGDGGYEVKLSDQPQDTQETLYIQLLDQTDNLPLSEKFYFNTFEDCERNLVVINFQQQAGP